MRSSAILILASFAILSAQESTPPPAPAQAQSQTPPAPGTKPPTSPPSQSSGLWGAAWSIEPIYWFTRAAPTVQGGKSASETGDGGFLKLPGETSPALGAELGLAFSANDALKFSFFQVKGRGDTPAQSDITLFSTSWDPGDFLVTWYRVQDYKVSFEDVLYPFGRTDAKLRFKTLWQMQYVNAYTSIDAPLKPTTDSAGNTIQTTGTGSMQLFYPSLGLAAEGRPAPKFRWEVKASGFGLPHLPSLWDAEATANYRIGSFELVAGGKGFHFKTDQHGDQYMTDTMMEAFAGVRWYFLL